MEKRMYYSSNGVDEFLHKEMGDIKYGFFVEIGAAFGRQGSNTLFFEDSLKWHGILIEPNPPKYVGLVKNRPNPFVKKLQCAIWKETALLMFYQPMGGGGDAACLKEAVDAKRVKEIRDYNESRGGHINEIQVATRTFNPLMAENGVTKIDYLSIDAEGADFTILKTVDFDLYSIPYISVENWGQSEEVRDFMDNCGYELLNHLGDDDIYRKLT